MKKLIFKGAATALITPMTEDGKINYQVLQERQGKFPLFLMRNI